MNFIKRFTAIFICAALLCSCGAKPKEESDGSREISIQTYAAPSETETAPATTAETLNTDRLIAPDPETTAAPSRVPPATSTEPSATKPASSETKKRTESEEQSGDYVITPADSVMYASSSVNVREEPDADSDRVGHLEKGDKVNVTGLVSNGWVRISFKDGEYFVNGSYLSEADSEIYPAETEQTTMATEAAEPEPEKTQQPEPTETLPPPEPEPDTPSTDGDEYVIMDAEGAMRVTDTLNVREAPDVSSNKVGTLHTGETVTVTGIVSNGWVRIIFEGKERFVSGEYLALVSEDEPDSAVQNTGALMGSNSYNAVNYAEQKAVWLAYLDIDEMIKNAGRAEFTSRIANAYDEIVSLGCNTVYVHVRSFGDAYYYSAYYPFTAAYADKVGAAPDYDPLSIMISEAHARGLSFHAWINPMRTTTKQRFKEMSSEYAIKQWYDSDSANGTFLVYDSESGYYWLSPAYTAVRNLICAGVAEIVSNYDVDAIHIDDYFYPTTSSSFDKAAFAASGESDRDKWRRNTVNTLVKEIYSTVKSCNSSVLFGVSPQGNIENNMNRLYADVKTWCSTPGYLDYIVPQIYYGFNDKLSFSAAAEQWIDITTLSSVKLICGIAAYKVGTNSEWSSGSILSEQTDYIAGLPRFSGVAYYRHGSLFGSASSSEKLMRTELKALATSVSSF